MAAAGQWKFMEDRFHNVIPDPPSLTQLQTCWQQLVVGIWVIFGDAGKERIENHHDGWCSVKSLCEIPLLLMAAGSEH